MSSSTPISHNNSSSGNSSKSDDEDGCISNKEEPPQPQQRHQQPPMQQLVQTILAGLSIPLTHGTVGMANLLVVNKNVRTLLVHRKLPIHGWSDHTIQWFLITLSTLDTNHKQPIILQNHNHNHNNHSSVRWCGVGEREGRVYSTLVAQRHYGFSHGVGKSGSLTEAQPKAVGSTLLAQVTLHLVLDAIRQGSGLHATTAAAHGILLPLCTGMSLALVLRSLRDQHQHQPNDNNHNQNSSNHNKKPELDVVLWSRIDQKSCYKAVTAAGFTCVIVPTVRHGDCVTTDLEALVTAIATHQGRILAVITTTSCFAPRISDRIDEVAKLCRTHNLHHVINNAYGLQCRHVITKLINRACAVGRVDAIVCSTDKNFLVPVGGAIVLSPSASTIQTIGRVYAGRASASPLIDLCITLLAMGLEGYQQLLAQRQSLLTTFRSRLEAIAHQYGERLLQCTSNTISYAITLDTLIREKKNLDKDDDDVYRTAVGQELTQFGSMLFHRCVSGTRVVPRHVIQRLGPDHTVIGFGSSCDDYPHAYLTAACAIGVSDSEINEFMRRLEKTFCEFKKKQVR